MYSSICTFIFALVKFYRMMCNSVYLCTAIRLVSDTYNTDTYDLYSIKIQGLKKLLFFSMSTITYSCIFQHMIHDIMHLWIENRSTFAYTRVWESSGQFLLSSNYSLNEYFAAFVSLSNIFLVGQTARVSLQGPEEIVPGFKGSMGK